MTAGAEKFVSSVQGCRFRLEHYQEFLSQTKLVASSDRIENPGSGKYFPGYIVRGIFPFQLLDVFAQCGAALIGLILEI